MKFYDWITHFSGRLWTVRFLARSSPSTDTHQAESHHVVHKNHHRAKRGANPPPLINKQIELNLYVRSCFSSFESSRAFFLSPWLPELIIEMFVGATESEVATPFNRERHREQVHKLRPEQLVLTFRLCYASWRLKLLRRELAISSQRSTRRGVWVTSNEMNRARWVADTKSCSQIAWHHLNSSIIQAGRTTRTWSSGKTTSGED